MLALEQLFPPPVSLSSGHCNILAGNEPKRGPFRGICRYFHGRLERMFISHFSFSATEQADFQTTHTCTDTHAHETPAFPSLTRTSESSECQLPLISSIFYHQTGSHYKALALISHWSSREIVQHIEHCVHSQNFWKKNPHKQAGTDLLP